MSRSAMGRRRIVTTEEQDVYTGWRRVACWTQRAGAVKAVKRNTHRRERRESRQEIAEAWEEGYAAGQVDDDDGDRENPYRSGGAA